jgi:hypothetical protein
MTAPVLRHALIALTLALIGMSLAGCKKRPNCVDKSKKPLEECRLNSDKLQAEIVTLKRQLAQALANPGSIKVDPEVLAVEGKIPKEIKPKEGTLTQEQVIATMRRNKTQLKACYERAMKKNVRLQQQKITLTIGFRVHANGTAQGIYIRPNYDYTMNDCMKKSIKRWRFPAFTGQPVGVESPLTLSPQK